jgi:prefoldin subunit 5
MQKNARGYVQDSVSALNEAKDSLQNALNTVEKGSNRDRIEQTLQQVNSALESCDQTVGVLGQE